MILVAAAIEDNLLQTLCKSSLSKQRPHRFGFFDLVQFGSLGTYLVIEGRRCDQCVPSLIVNNLGEDVSLAAEDIEPRALRRPCQIVSRPRAPMSAVTQDLFCVLPWH